MLPKNLRPSFCTKPHPWIVFKRQDGRLGAALLKNPKDFKYYQARPDIQAFILTTALNRSQALHKGKPLLEDYSFSP